MGRKEYLHAQFWVVQEGLHTIAIVFVSSQRIVWVVRVRVGIIRSSIGFWIRVFGWCGSLLEQADIYAKLKRKKKLDYM